MENNEQTLFKFVKKENNKYVINLDDPEIQDYIKNQNLKNISNEDLMSLFFHYTEIPTESSIYNLENLNYRYFGDNRICYTCGETGHIENKCKKKNQLVCILCGNNDHEKYSCPQIVCQKCNLCGHKFKDCNEKVDRKRFCICRKCPYKHSISECSFFWRKYKLLHNHFKIFRRSCPVCFSDKHFIDDCHENKSKFSIFTNKFKFLINRSKKK